MLKKVGVEVVLVKKPEQIEGLKGLILPGGESTTISKLLNFSGLRDAIIDAAQKGLAIWGTCAGAILLAKEIVDGEQVESLGLMDIKVQRNAYGRQLDSFETELEFDGEKIPAVFIRAPKIMSAAEGVEVLAEIDGEIVAARQGKFLATSFHPELTDETKIHEWFVQLQMPTRGAL